MKPIEKLDALIKINKKTSILQALLLITSYSTLVYMIISNTSLKLFFIVVPCQIVLAIGIIRLHKKSCDDLLR